MAANRWKVITLSAGGAVLLLMLLASSFALGVYVGEHGWTREGLSYSGPGANNRPAQGAPAQAGPAQGGPAQGGAAPAATQQIPLAPAGLPQGKPNLTGRILRIHPQSIEVASPDGPRVVLLSPQTRFLEQDGRTITLRDLANGDLIAVYGLTTGDGGALQAEFIVRLPAKQ
jgi:hypothetical protein